MSEAAFIPRKSGVSSDHAGTSCGYAIIDMLESFLQVTIIEKEDGS
jgi:hypothetical protein